MRQIGRLEVAKIGRHYLALPSKKTFSVRWRRLVPGMVLFLKFCFKLLIIMGIVNPLRDATQLQKTEPFMR